MRLEALGRLSWDILPLPAQKNRILAISMLALVVIAKANQEQDPTCTLDLETNCTKLCEDDANFSCDYICDWLGPRVLTDLRWCAGECRVSSKNSTLGYIYSNLPYAENIPLVGKLAEKINRWLPINTIEGFCSTFCWPGKIVKRWVFG